MQIFIHWLEFSHRFQAHQLDDIASLLNLPRKLFKQHLNQYGTAIYTASIDKKEIASITFPKKAEGTIKLRGGYFDHLSDSHTIYLPELWRQVQNHSGHALKIDISYLDDLKTLSFPELLYMSSLDNYKKYITGSVVRAKKLKGEEKPDSNNRQGIPDIHANHPLIHYGGPADRSSAKIYRRPDNLVKVEITLKVRAQVAALLNTLTTDDPLSFFTASLQALVKVIHFVKPASKRAKKTVPVDSWKQFLNGDIKPLRWSDHVPKLEEKPLEETLLYHVSRLSDFIQKSVAAHNQPQILDLLEQVYTISFDNLMED